MVKTKVTIKVGILNVVIKENHADEAKNVITNVVAITVTDVVKVSAVKVSAVKVSAVKVSAVKVSAVKVNVVTVSVVMVSVVTVNVVMVSVVMVSVVMVSVVMVKTNVMADNPDNETIGTIAIKENPESTRIINPNTQLGRNMTKIRAVRIETRPPHIVNLMDKLNVRENNRIMRRRLQEILRSKRHPVMNKKFYRSSLEHPCQLLLSQ
jgi:hypothetical protein